MKILVNIYNTGNLFGLKTPAYRIPMDESLYEFYKDMGFMIEPSTDKNTPARETAANTASAEERKEAVPSQEAPKRKRARKKYVAMPKANDPRLADPEYGKDSYTDTDLARMRTIDMVLILTKRGHASLQNSRDPLAPKALDRRSDLIAKIMKTNK